MKEINGIKLVRILPSDYVLFRQFDPFNTLDMMVLPGAFALGAIDEGRYAGKTALAGLMTVTSKRDMLIIEWLAVDPEYREMEIGSALCDTVFETAKELGMAKVCVRLEEGDFSVNEAWFKDGFFTQEEECPGVYRLGVGSFTAQKVFHERAVSKAVKPLAKLSASNRAQIPEFSDKAAVSHKHGNIAALYGLCDKELSCAYTENGELKGVLLILSVEDRHFPLLLAADSENILEDMITYSAAYADDNLSIGDTLIVFCDSDDIRSIMKDYIGDKGYIKRKLLYGTVDEFVDDSKEKPDVSTKEAVIENSYGLRGLFGLEEDDEFEEFLYDEEDREEESDEEFDEEFDEDEADEEDSLN